MQLNIKNAAAHRMASELAELTGESLTGAVTAALKEKLARLKQVGPRRGAKAEALLAIGRDCAKRLKGDAATADHGALLYDERGLPK